MATFATTTNDKDLLAQIAKHDRNAIRVLYGRHQVKVFRFLVRFVKNEAVAEELVNETFIEIWRSAVKFEGRSAPTTWMFSIARFKALNVLRKKSDEELDEATSAKIEDYSDNPEVTTMKGNKAEILQQCLGKLSDEHREVIDLVYYHEKSIDEISQIVGIPSGTVKTRVFHARKQLSVILQRAGVDRGWP